MTWARRLLPLVAALVLGVGRASAQPTRESQIPIDPDHGVLEIGPDLRRQLGLFTEQQGFQVAQLFQRGDGSLVLEVSRVEGGRLYRERRDLSEAELDALRSDLGARFAARGQARAVDRAGRGGFVLMETLLGVGLYGWAVPRGLDIHSSRGGVAAYLLTAGASYYLPFRITRNASMSIVERNAAVWGSTRGVVHGLFVGKMLNGREDYAGADSDKRDRTLALSMLGTSVVETILAYQIAQGTGATEGQVAYWSAVGDFGIPFGLGAAYLAGLFDENVAHCEFGYCSVDEVGETSLAYGAALAVAVASPWIARHTKQGDFYTVGDARALRSFGILGAQLALVPAWAAFQDRSDDLDKATVAALMAGSGVGLWAGNAVLKNRSLSGGDGLLVLAGHVAGGLGALGVTYLLDGGARADDLVYITTSALGSAAGSLLTLQAVSGGASTPRAAARIGVQLNPVGLIPELRAPVLTLRF